VRAAPADRPKDHAAGRSTFNVLSSVKLRDAYGKQGDANDQSNKPAAHLWVHDSSYLVEKWNMVTRTIMPNTTTLPMNRRHDRQKNQATFQKNPWLASKDGCRGARGETILG